MSDRNHTGSTIGPGCPAAINASSTTTRTFSRRIGIKSLAQLDLEVVRVQRNAGAFQVGIWIDSATLQELEQALRAVFHLESQLTLRDAETKAMRTCMVVEFEARIRIKQKRLDLRVSGRHTVDVHRLACRDMRLLRVWREPADHIGSPAGWRSLTNHQLVVGITRLRLARQFCRHINRARQVLKEAQSIGVAAQREWMRRIKKRAIRAKHTG